MRYRIIQTLLLLSFFTCSRAQGVITHAEYFFDTDTGFNRGSRIAIPAGQTSFDTSFNADISRLTEGFHVLFLRVRNDNGWGVTNSWLFLKQTSTPDLPELTRVEYFFDADPGTGNGNPVKEILNLQINNATAEQGSIYVIDAAGKTVLKRVIELKTGSNLISLPASSLAKGVYTLLLLQNARTRTIQFLKE